MTVREDPHNGRSRAASQAPPQSTSVPLSKLQGSHLSSMKTLVDDGRTPYPIFAAIDNDLHSAWQKEKSQSKQKIRGRGRPSGVQRH